jgi:hypothetical protein
MMGAIELSIEKRPKTYMIVFVASILTFMKHKEPFYFIYFRNNFIPFCFHSPLFAHYPSWYVQGRLDCKKSILSSAVPSTIKYITTRVLLRLFDPLNMKPHMHLVEISIFSQNNVTVRPTKIMNRVDKTWAHF